MKKFILPLLILFFCSLTSCIHKKLRFEDGMKVKVVFDWSKVGINVSDENPKSVRLYFFNEQGELTAPKYLQYGKEGGYCILPEGKYKFIAYNDDIETFSVINDERFSSLLINLTKTDTTGNKAFLPVPLYVSSLGGENSVTIDGRDGQMITMVMNKTIRNFHVRLNGLKHTERLKDNVICSIDGFVRGITPSNNAQTSETVEHSMELSHDKTNNVFLKDFPTLGWVASSGKTATLTLTFVLKDGQKVTKTIDVTDQIVNAHDPWDVWINIDGSTIELPEPIVNNDGAFSAEVDDWDEEVINIPNE